MPQLARFRVILNGDMDTPSTNDQSLSVALGEQLVRRGKLAAEQLEQVIRLQTEKGGLLGPLLVQLGFIGERDLAETLAESTGWLLAGKEDYLDVAGEEVPVSEDFLRQHYAVPLRVFNDAAEVALADPSDGFVVEALKLALGRPVSPRIGLMSDIQAALSRRFPGTTEVEAQTGEARITAGSEADEIAHLRDMASEAPVIRRVNELIVRAREQRASDIHIEPFEHGVVVRYRIDGALRQVPLPRGISPAAIISRIKVMANLNIAERRLPQDGRIQVRVEGREMDMRISTVPTLYGESVVMRLLDRGEVNLDFAALGFEGETLHRFRQMLARPHGIVLVTGPTGSGKTTTLYAALDALNTPDKKILTVEDPVEYQLEGINQIPVRPQIDLTFANALRAILRQDPDIIMIGEMRDIETARIAVQAALTGHKVFSTLHTNDAASSITRMQDMQVDDYLLTSTIDGVLAQRLVRTLCTHCRVPYQPPEALVQELGLDRLSSERPLTLYRAGGCTACDNTGYRGRTTILELMVMSEAMRRAVIARQDADALRQLAQQEGMIDMRSDGLRKALAGLTTIEEVERVTQTVSGPV
jgi:general secretion pathway protein E